ncbi:HAMP domain-containing histidine kinase [Pseudonocardia sp. DSM 110487]|uniref:sensor histidine kinase n=1 Tax=Pseudonocardia sp. DSM 110487 TaxID=2865833 RepID=UPI001C69EA9C|nr:HAMP domain-containing sensor histidine kinase [Pseudonocardia sp. DSM 110487]QYN32196.1 HAMP domain-containing histidine kinase [Pseudonocardia sp. DSM 110487]
MRRPAWAQTIRFRLAATYSLVLFALAALVLVAVYAVVSQSVDAAPLNPITVQKVKEVGGELVLKDGEQFQAADLASVQEAVNHKALELMRDASAGALGGLLIASFGVGWWLSGRVLRPVKRVTAAAREISATDLSRRIALDGPRDELRDLADTVDDMLSRLDRAFAAQRQMIDDASHELRNPLAIIQINLDAVLSRDDVDTAERQRASTVTARATQRMGSLIEDLLAAARRAAPAFTDADVDLGQVADEAADAFALLADSDGLRVERRPTPGLGVIGDAEALRRAVDNLLSNAVRVSPQGEEIVLATGRHGGWAWLAVRDHGPGISVEHQERVFDRFWRGPDGTRRRDRGTGLGLAIVRQVVESHGGTVAVHSAPGEGATFVLWLPMRGAGVTERTPRPPSVDPLAAGSAVPS